jgi:predicted transcriptional regulator
MEDNTMMKMTVMIPEDLHRRAKATAALQRTSLSVIVQGALEDYITAALRQNAAIQEFLTTKAHIDSGEEKLYDWDEVKENLMTTV